MRKALIFWLLAIPASAATSSVADDTRCAFDTVCDIGGGCRSDDVDVRAVITGPDDAPRIAVSDGLCTPAAVTNSGDLRGYVVSYPRVAAIDPLTVTSQGAAQLAVIYGGHWDFVYSDTCRSVS